MKKDFPFLFAILLAFVLHFLIGVFLHYRPLASASSMVPSAPEQPLNLTFVEVPPNATSVPQAPAQARRLSDANRKAGPLVATHQPPRPVVPNYGSRPATGSPRQSSSPAPQQQPANPSQSPAGQEPAADTNDPAAMRAAQQQSAQQLSQSLKNLDQFIGKGGNGAGSSGGDGDSPQGDPGSGVFFDTQGFDLGPWANRVVAIVRSNWIVPVAADLGLKGVTGISFKVDRQGNILDLKVISQSGVPSFDQSALNSLKSSSPLPPLPADFPRDLLPGVFRFYYNTPVPQ